MPEETISAGDLLKRRRREHALLSEEVLDRIENLKQSDSAPADKRSPSPC